MNLGLLATAVGQRLGVDTSQNSTRDGAAVRSFLTIRHDQLYRAFLWRDSVIEFALSVDPSVVYVPTANYMPSKGRVILPSIFQHVLGVRLGCRSLAVQRPMLYYRANYSAFFNSGYAAEFMLLSSCVWEFDTVQNLLLQNANTADDNVPVTLDLLDSNEVSVTRSIVDTISSVVAAGSTDRVDNFIKPATQGLVSIVQPTAGAPVELVVAGQNYVIPNSSPGYYALVIIGFTIGQSFALNLGNAESLASGTFPPQVIVANGNYIATSTSYTLLIPYSGALPPPAILCTSSIISQTIAFNAISTLQSTDLSAPKSQRIQLVGKPTSAPQSTQTLHVLGKRVTPPFSDESDVVGVNGLEGILFALAYYDFKQRDEAGGSSDALTALNEAVGPQFLLGGKPGGFLGKLIEEEVIQAAYNCRIIPDHGFGGVGYFDEPFGPGKAYW